MFFSMTLLALVVVLVLVFLAFQIFVPMWNGTPLFPVFSRRIRAAEEKVVQARGDIEAKTIENYAENITTEKPKQE